MARLAINLVVTLLIGRDPLTMQISLSSFLHEMVGMALVLLPKEKKILILVSITTMLDLSSKTILSVHTHAPKRRLHPMFFTLTMIRLTSSCVSPDLLVTNAQYFAAHHMPTMPMLSSILYNVCL